MPLNPDAVGAQSEPAEFSWTSKDALLYAVSIGAGAERAGVHDREHQRRRAAGLPDVPGRDGLRRRRPLGDGEHRHVQPGAAGARPAGRDAAPADPRPRHGDDHVEADRHVRQGQGGGRRDRVDRHRRTVEPLYTTRSSAFIRGEGGWGGERGPSGPQNVPPDRAPDHEVTYDTSPDQAFVYRLNGDRNPLHTDPSFAAMGGFDRPILHGLCSYGFTGRGAAAHAVRVRSGPLPAHRGPLRRTGPARGVADDHGVGHERRRGGVHDLGRRPRRHRPGPPQALLIR